MELFELIELLENDILLPEIDIEKANKAFHEVDLKLKKAGFKTKNESVFAYLLDSIWSQAEKEYNHLL